MIIQCEAKITRIGKDGNDEGKENRSIVIGTRMMMRRSKCSRTRMMIVMIVMIIMMVMMTKRRRRSSKGARYDIST